MFYLLLAALAAVIVVLDQITKALVLANIPLITEKHVELDMTEYYKEKIQNIISTTQFKLLVGALVLLIILFIFTRAIRKSHEKRVSELNKRRKISMAPTKKKKNSLKINP